MVNKSLGSSTYNWFNICLILGILLLPQSITAADQVVITPDKTVSPAFHTSTATCYGTNANTHINLGFGTSVTGTDGESYSGCTVGGGSYNKASGRYSTVGGGYQNDATADGATVGGGSNNTAGGNYSWAGGRNMKLEDTSDHTFVWGYSDSTQSISTANAFLIFPAGTTGNVGIGTEAPDAVLEVAGTHRHQTLRASESPGGPDVGRVEIGYDSSGDYGKVFVWDGATGIPANLVLGGANVGIGTPTPKCLLDERDENSSFDSSDIGNLQLLVGNNATSTSGGKAAIGFAVSNVIDDYNVFGAMITHTPEDSYSNGGIEFWTKDTNTSTITLTEKMRIDRNGNVGIGTDNPQYDLDVAGDIRATGSVYYGGTSGSADGTAYTKPDYVFEEGYQILSTDQVAKHLEEQNSLPWITSLKQEQEENGPMVDMTRMSFETVETVENLQVQIIALSNIIKEQQRQIDYLLNKAKH